MNNCVSDSVSDLVGKVDRGARKSWITLEMISKMGEGREWKVVNNKAGKEELQKTEEQTKNCHRKNQGRPS
jgi:hypothetical protein